MYYGLFVGFIYPYSWAMAIEHEVSLCSAEFVKLNETGCIEHFLNEGKDPYSITYWR
jgi:hypothetical protein